MPCIPVEMGNGNVAIACSRSRPAQRFCGCGRRATLLCDWPTEARKSGTCDKPICDRCSRHIGTNDYCPFHRGEPPKTAQQLELAGADAATEAARILGVPPP